MVVGGQESDFPLQKWRNSMSSKGLWAYRDLSLRCPTGEPGPYLEGEFAGLRVHEKELLEGEGCPRSLTLRDLKVIFLRKGSRRDWDTPRRPVSPVVLIIEVSLGRDLVLWVPDTPTRDHQDRSPRREER